MRLKAFVNVSEQASADFYVTSGFDAHLQGCTRFLIHPHPSGKRWSKPLLLLTRMEVRIARQVVNDHAPALPPFAMAI